MDGNVDAAGITADLEWLQAIGVRGVQQFEGGMGTPLVVDSAVEHGTAEWRELFAHAVREADRLGLEFSVASSPGWSSAGGPWVDPADAMQKLVWSETTFRAGAHPQLPPLPSVAGPFQDIPAVGSSQIQPYCRDLVVVAIPEDQDQDPLRPNRVSTSQQHSDVEVLFDRLYGEPLEFERDPNARSTAWVIQEFDEPVAVASITIATPAPHGFGAAPQAEGILEYSVEGEHFEVAVRIPPTRLDVRTIAFSEITGRFFRLTLHGDTAQSALPPLAPEMRVPNVLRTTATFKLSEFALWAHPRIHQGELKAGFAAADDYYELDAPDGCAAGIKAENVIDVSEHLGSDGVLRWDAPAGSWRIIRLGHSPTGHRNGPAPAASTGLEVDKMDSGRVENYFARYLQFYRDALSDDGSPRIRGLLSDSIESGPQNATAEVRSRFRELRGYDFAKWVPALTGRIVGNAADSDRFLFDFRRTLSDLISSEYYATTARVAHEHGLLHYTEALEDGRPQLGDDLAMRSHADIPMGAAWLFDADTEASRPTYIADLRGASSVAHVYGKSFTGAESMTAFHRAWSYTPRTLKHVADLELALGVTRFCIHTSPHQPSVTPKPGIGLAPFLGQAFTRLETWAGFADAWIDYLSRCSYLLNQGVPAVDVAVFIGEEGPITGLFNENLDSSVPIGIGFDYINLDALSGVVRVDEGDLVAAGARYRLLFLGGSSSRMTVAGLRRIAELIAAGGTVVGTAPTSSPSLADNPNEFSALVGELWGDGNAGVRDEPLASALRSLGVAPAIRVTNHALRVIGRRLPAGELLFISNPSQDPASTLVESDRQLTQWDPVTAASSSLHALGGPGAFTYELVLPSTGSIFLLQGMDGLDVTSSGEVIESFELVGPWELRQPGGDVCAVTDLTPWSALGLGEFSGVVTYSTSFELVRSESARTSYHLSVGGVHDIARVVVNGSDCGVVWTSPDEIDISGAVRNGVNTLEISVANSWMNRLIAEAKESTGELFAPTTTVYSPNATPQVTGLLGPVRVLRFEAWA